MKTTAGGRVGREGSVLSIGREATSAWIEAAADGRGSHDAAGG